MTPHTDFVRDPNRVFPHERFALADTAFIRNLVGPYVQFIVIMFFIFSSDVFVTLR